MSSFLTGLGAARVAPDPSSIRLAASRSHASPLQSSVRLTLGTPAASPSGMACSCLQCGSSASPTLQAARTGAGAAAAALPVDYTDRIKKRGRITTDALVAGGNRWFHTAGASGEIPSAVAKKTLSFSFIESSAGLNGTDANGFAALNSTQRERVRDAFEYLSSVIDVQFTEAGSGGDIQFGSNTQAGSAGYARYPNEGSQVFMANNQAGFDSGWEEGGYAWQTLLHETGHALGLKHPGNYNAGGGGTAGPYLSRAADNRNNTIMSYHNGANKTRLIYDNGSFSKSTVNASTFQGYDIEALQYLYGASSTVTARSYQWEAGLAFSNTLWNPNGGSEINLANQTGMNVVDLRAGKRSSIGIVDPYSDMPFTRAEYAALKSGGKALTSILGTPTYTGNNNLLLAAGSQFTRGIGGSGNDKFVANTVGGHVDGGGGDDQLFWTGGNLEAVGGEGSDTLLLKRVAGATWSVNAEGTQATLSRKDLKTQAVTTLSTVSMSGIESVRYWNGLTLKAGTLSLYAAPAASPALHGVA
jgi:Metallo-peptidase family M12